MIKCPKCSYDIKFSELHPVLGKIAIYTRKLARACRSAGKVFREEFAK